MIIGLGTDIIEIERVRKAISKNHFRENVFTTAEQIYCDGRGKSSVASYAARFAAKEAFFKATGRGIFTALTDVEILNNTRGAPKINLRGKAKSFAESLNVKNISLSLSHSRDFAIATCILE